MKSEKANIVENQNIPKKKRLFSDETRQGMKDDFAFFDKMNAQATQLKEVNLNAEKNPISENSFKKIPDILSKMAQTREKYLNSPQREAYLNNANKK